MSDQPCNAYSKVEREAAMKAPVASAPHSTGEAQDPNQSAGTRRLLAWIRMMVIAAVLVLRPELAAWLADVSAQREFWL